jgi:hypothetical protein
MRPEEAIALVFAMAGIWAGTILVLLSRLDRPERRARRQERRADRAVHERSHRVTRARRLAHYRRPARRGRSRIR